MEEQLGTSLRVFQQLQLCSLVVNQCVTDETISEFQNLLNTLDMSTEMMKNTRSFVKCMYDMNKSAFYNYVKISDQQYLTLFTNGGPLAIILNINNLVLIKYHWQQQNFLVSKLRYRKNRDQNEGQKTIQLGRDRYPIEKKKKISSVSPDKYSHMYVIKKPEKNESISILQLAMLANWGDEK